MEESRNSEPTEYEETIQNADEETMRQFISRTRIETEHHKLNRTEMEPKDKQYESKLESIGTFRRTNRNSSKENESTMKKNTRTILLALSEATESKNGFWNCNVEL